MKKSLMGIICFFACILSIQAQTLYGTTTRGGNDGGGTISKFIPATNDLTVAKSFEGLAAQPIGSLIHASNGKLYGMTERGGTRDRGVIFSFDPSSSNYTKLKDFDGANGASPRGSLMQASDGKLYGMTSQGGSYGYENDNNGYGVIFSFDPSSSTYTKLKDFNGSNGRNPSGSLMEASDGKLYGMTSQGGSYGYENDNNGYGVIFSFDPSTSTYTKLKDFDGTNGSNPSGSLIEASDGKLYGMTTFGGSNNLGVIFSFDPSSSTYTKLKDFYGADGDNPYGNLIQATDGKLYGMTVYGGSVGGLFGYGVIFSFDPSSSTYTKLKGFDGTNGENPYGSLIQASDGKLYGMTLYGGIGRDEEAGGGGVIFSFDPSTSTYTKLKDFDRTNGRYPYGSLMQASDGKLYGTTFQGGSSDVGVIFSFDPSSSTYTMLKDFGINETGSNVSASLIQARDGKLYGMTQLGGSKGFGVIFSFDPTSFTYTKLIDFDGANGANPYGSLMQASDGKLYGTADVIFSFDPSTSTYTKLGNSGSPSGSLLQASDGKLYGMTSGGGSTNQGVIFPFDPTSSTYTKLQDYTGANGATPGIGSAFIEVKDNQNGAPTVSLSIPYNIVKYTAPARIKLNAAATDKDGTITKVQFFNGNTRIHTEDVYPYGFLWIDVPVGTYTLTAKLLITVAM
jgi:uncharacterized repeat protein (TIGR03803 family)